MSESTNIPRISTPLPPLSTSTTPSPEPSRLPTPLNGVPLGHHTNGDHLRPPPAGSPALSVSPDPATNGTLRLPQTDQYDPRGSLPNTILAVSVISTVLGAIAASSITLAARPILTCIPNILGQYPWCRPQLGIYVAAVAIFHLLEFWTTAGWNPQKLSVDAFLLNNTAQYHYAHAFGLAEYILSSYLFPGKFQSIWGSLPLLSLIALGLIVFQSIRSLAMIQAAQSFSHVVKARKHDDHVLVTHGLYSWSRHPSYTGFFYWAVLTQLLLSNFISTLGFVVVLARFFSRRIIEEEKWLVKFFGDEYVQYRRRVGTKLPFVSTPP